MWIASCTKLLTAICVMQCVEKGLLNLDDDISTVLDEWKEPRRILTGFDETTGEPKFEEAKGKINLRMLLTHQSGMSYAFPNTILEKYVAWRKIADKDKETSGRIVNITCINPLEQVKLISPLSCIAIYTFPSSDLRAWHVVVLQCRNRLGGPDGRTGEQ